MKNLSYLVRTAYGFAFRLRVPRDLAQYLPQQSVKHALRGYDQRQAQLAALLLAGRYARAFDNLRQGTRAMAKKGKDTSHLINLNELVEQAGEALTEARAEDRVSKLLNRSKEASASHGQKDLKLGIGANGPFLETEAGDSPEIIQAAMQTLQSMMASKPAPAAPSPSSVKAIAATKAADEHLDHITPTTTPKTLTIKKAAVNGFVAHYLARTGNKKAKLADATSGDVGAWVSMLHKTLAPNYVHNKAVYVQHLFKWGMANNYYPQGQNPAVGHTAFTKRQQQARLKHGFRAFTPKELQALFDTNNFAKVGPATRWGIVLALYTGARASEIGQLRITDFGIYQKGMLRENPLLPLDPQPKGKDWVYAINITDEGPGQRLKGADSRRTLHIHQDLITLGLLDRVRELRDRGEDQFFPGVKLTNKNGAGNWLSKQFSNYRAPIVPDNPNSTRKIGLHSFRKTTTQTLQKLGGSDALRHFYLGHDPGTVQSTTYADLAPLMQEQWFGTASYGVSVPKLHSLMNEQKQRLQKNTRKANMTKAEEAEKAQKKRV